MSLRAAETTTSSSISMMLTVLFLTAAPSLALEQGCPGLVMSTDTSVRVTTGATSRALVARRSSAPSHAAPESKPQRPREVLEEFGKIAEITPKKPRRRECMAPRVNFRLPTDGIGESFAKK